LPSPVTGLSFLRWAVYLDVLIALGQAQGRV
jgi:hypothetical protein